jgi:Holliday junction resolvase RusA-like endonuclease
MVDEIVVELAGAPMAKERVRVTKVGHAYTPQRTVNYEARLAHAAQIAMAGRPLLDGPLAVVVTITMPIAESKPKKWREAALVGKIRPVKKPDCDNFAKCLDSLNLIVWSDDSQIVDLHVVKFYGAKPSFKAVIAPLVSYEGAFA